MARPKVTLDRGGVRELLSSAGVRGALGVQADAVREAAVRSAPVATGEYRDGIERASVTTDRAVERVVATAPHSNLVEARTGNLARALGAVGGAS